MSATAPSPSPTRTPPDGRATVLELEGVSRFGGGEQVKVGAGFGHVPFGLALGVANGARFSEKVTQPSGGAVGRGFEKTAGLVTQRPAAAEQVDEGKRELLLQDVGAERLARFLFGANEIEYVIGNLEGNAEGMAE